MPVIPMMPNVLGGHGVHIVAEGVLP
jgi:hypothetical protein